MATDPKFRRRKEDRPGEIISAAITVFAEKGFAAAKLEEIARRAGVSKGALYLYFANKEELFHAMVNQAVTPNVDQVRAMVDGFDGHLADMLPALPPAFGRIARASHIAPIAKVVIGESRNFPALARLWHDEVVDPMLSLLTRAIARGQDRGEVRDGDPRLYAMQMAGPMVLGLLWQQVMVPAGGAPFDFEALARQHVDTFARGVLLPQESGR